MEWGQDYKWDKFKEEILPGTLRIFFLLLMQHAF